MSGTNFFDFREQVTARRAPAQSPAQPDALTVSQLTAQIDAALRRGVPASVFVKGEVSNFSLHRPSGNLYFTLKDPRACIDCVMFRSEATRLKFDPTDGMELLAQGRVGVYAQRGRYQLYVQSLQPLGAGALELAFKQLCQKLEREGLFAAERKKPLPAYPMCVALVTSRGTAALQDMLKVLRRFPWLRLVLFHVPVQGEGAAQQIALALQTLRPEAAHVGGIDLILLARGGGSLEDLWAFNEECVARAMASSRIPIVTGIGHEIDVSIADLVADYHAHTPTEAAQVATAHWRAAAETVTRGATRLQRALRQVLQEAKHRFTSIARHELFRRPMDRINTARLMLDDRERRLYLAASHAIGGAARRCAQLQSRMVENHPRHALRLKRQQLDALRMRLDMAAQERQRYLRLQLDSLDSQLRLVSVDRVLRRGFTITRDKKTGIILRSAAAVRANQRITTQFHDGPVESTADDSQQPRLFE